MEVRDVAKSISCVCNVVKFTSDACLRIEKNGKLPWDACVFLYACEFLFSIHGISTNYSAKCLGGLICDLVRDAVID